METLREKLYRAAISCGHEITKDQIILYADTRKEGNALSQLADRLEQSIKQLEQELESAKKDQALTFKDALKIAKGCTDYGGGYRSNPYELEIYHHGIGTVVNCLEAAIKRGLQDTQLAVLHSIGSAAIKEST